MIQEFVDMVQSLRASNSTNHKKSVLAQYKDSKIVRELLFLTYNPYLNYYVTKPEVTVGSTPTAVDEVAYKAFKSLLMAANARTITPAQLQSQLQELLGDKSAEVVDHLLLVVKRDIKGGVNVSTINAVMGKDVLDVNSLSNFLSSNRSLELDYPNLFKMLDSNTLSQLSK